jgi:hypothetical protein
MNKQEKIFFLFLHTHLYIILTMKQEERFLISNQQTKNNII